MWRKSLRVVLSVSLLETIVLVGQVWADFVPPPTLLPYYTQTMGGFWRFTPTYGYEQSTNGNVWAEAQAGVVTAWTLQSQYHVNDSFDGFGIMGRAPVAGAKFVQQYIATAASQTIDFAWSGSMNLSGPTGPGMDYWLDYGLDSAVGWYDQNTSQWVWPGSSTVEASEMLDTNNQGPKNVSGNDQLNLSYAPGTTFAVWFVQRTQFGYIGTSNSGSILADSDFYNTFGVTGVSGAEPVPEPATLLLLGLGSLALWKKNQKLEIKD